MISFSTYKRIYNFINRHLFRILFSGSFKKFGKKVSIVSPDIIEGEKGISLSDNVMINSKVWLLALNENNIQGTINIEENTYIGRFAHIVSLSDVKIEKNVLIADKVYISDNVHGYKNIDIPIKNQEILNKKEVLIKENSWIGENSVIIGSVIGKHSIIGSNSVVTSDIPDYSIAVGCPAKVIKKFNFETKVWEKI